MARAVPLRMWGVWGMGGGVGGACGVLRCRRTGYGPTVSTNGILCAVLTECHRPRPVGPARPGRFLGSLLRPGAPPRYSLCSCATIVDGGVVVSAEPVLDHKYIVLCDTVVLNHKYVVLCDTVCLLCVQV